MRAAVELARAEERFSGLVARDFRCIAQNGFGDPQNSYAHSMAWFRDHVFTSTTRNAMCGPKPFHDEVAKVAQVYPVPIPETSPWDNDFRAQIWRYNPRTDTWLKVYTAPMTRVGGGIRVPRQVGFRHMTRFQGPSDPEEALYAAGWSTRAGPGPTILRCSDGTHFEEVSEPGLGNNLSQGIRTLIPFKGRIFAAATGRGGSRDVLPDPMVILETEDPTRGEWRRACEPGFGNPRNLMVYEMAVYGSFLYAVTLNPYDGFELWKTDGEGRSPLRWSCVISGGAGRGKLNETCTSMAVFGGCLFLGGAILNNGFDRIFRVGPAAPELIRVHGDDSWDLIVGEPRTSEEGTRVPLSGMGPGFDWQLAGYLWQLCEHDGWLYVTTSDRTCFLPFLRFDELRDDMQRFFDREMVERLVALRGGFDLWRTRDGVNWTSVTRNGFDNRFNIGGRTLVSTPYGLCLGTANLFGPEVAVERTAGWTFEPNRRSGAEIWLGARRELRVGEARGPAPLRLATPAEAPVSGTSLVDEYFEDSGFHHCGHWPLGTRTPRHACENLMDELLAFTRPRAELRVPKPSTEAEDRAYLRKHMAGGGRSRPYRPRRDPVLDLACGKGGSTRHLMTQFDAAFVTGVTWDEALLAACRSRCAGATLLHARDLPLDLPSSAFAVIVCAEGLTRFGPRDATLQEVLRLLAPGGILVASERLDYDPDFDASAHVATLKDLGYSDAVAFDVTSRCSVPARRRSLLFVTEKTTSGELDDAGRNALEAELPGLGPDPGTYVLLSARRPAWWTA